MVKLWSIFVCIFKKCMQKINDFWSDDKLKRIGILFLALIVLVQSVGMFVFATNDASGSPKHVPRIVSVIFDDSGSMENDHNRGQGSGFDKDLDRWAYASYAMQTFIAMMSEEDALYVTKLDENPSSVKIRLENKKVEIEEFKNLSRGDGGDEGDFTASTWNVVPTAAQALVDAYETYGDNAKYYLVVMADGNLDPIRDEYGNVKRQQSYNEELPKAINDIGGTFENTDFETIFFNMGGVSITAPGVKKISAASSSQIVEGLKEVSATVMGRNELSKSNVKVNGGKVSFDISYPALSITVFAQKSNTSFENVRLTLTKDGKKVPCTIDTNTVKCADDLREVAASEKQVPAGFVSLITNGNTPLSKGKYMLDLSDYGISDSKDVVILVEPAVRIGCKYYVGDSKEPKSFDEIKKSLRAGQTLKIQCGLYEMTDDGSLGQEVDDKILSPEFNLSVNGEPVTDKVAGEKHTYRITMTPESVGKILEIMASVEPYQPFIHREVFVDLASVPGIEKGAEDVRLTKPMWKQWSDGKGEIVFKFSEKADALVESLGVRVDGITGLPAGVAKDLDNIRTDKNNLVYVPEFSGVTNFDDLPEKFTVSLYDLYSGDVVDDISVIKVLPEYKFEIDNGFAGESVSVANLSDNGKAIVFTLLADYDGSGKYVSVDKAGCEDGIEFSVETGILSGEITSSGGTVKYVPSYDASANDKSVYDVLGKEVAVYAEALVGTQKVISEKVKLEFGSGNYKIEVSNEISEPFTLDSIRKNKAKVVFTLLADYENDGTFSALASSDMSAKEMKIDTGKFSLPGETGIEYGPEGNPVGVYFIPQYDEKVSEKPFTEVAGRTHIVTATYKDAKASAKIEVKSPVFDVSVRKDVVEVLDYNLCNNTDGVEFSVSRDNISLSAEELKGLEPYSISLSKNQKDLVINTRVETAEDGTAYLVVIPTHKNKSVLTRWLSFFVSHGETTVTLTVGNDADSATVKIGVDMPSLIWFLIIIAIILYVLYELFCFATLFVFPKGQFYISEFAMVEGRTGYYFRRVQNKVKGNSGRFRAFLRAHTQPDRRKDEQASKFKRFMKKLLRVVSKVIRIHVPGMTIEKKINFNGKQLIFVNKEGSSLFKATYPQLVIDDDVSRNICECAGLSVERVLGNDRTYCIRNAGRKLTGSLYPMHQRRAIAIHDSRTEKIYVMFFLSQKEINKINKKNRAKRQAEKARKAKGLR